MRAWAAGAAMVAVLLAGCGSSAPPPPVTVTATVTVTVTPETILGKRETMPDLVGMNLQEAQDRMQAMGSYLMDQQDASGRGRMQLVDSNWKVCSQEPAAGAEFALTSSVVLRAVKNDEQCP